MAQARRISVLGPVVLVMREQPDLRSALTSLIRLGWAQAEGLETALEDDGETAILSLTLAPVLPRPAIQTIELALAALVRLLRHFLGAGWAPQMVTFSHRRPADTRPYAGVLGITPIFRMDRDAIIFLTSELDRPIADADPALRRQLERYVESVQRQPGRRRSEQIGDAIGKMLPTGRCRADAIANLFGVDRRTLHRWLQDEGTSFSKLLDQTRTALSERHLNEAVLSLGEIAQLLGYSSLSAYSRWRRATQRAAKV